MGSTAGQREQRIPKGSQLFLKHRMGTISLRYDIHFILAVSFLQTLFPFAQTDHCCTRHCCTEQLKMSHNDAEKDVDLE